jgi:alpha-ketoglutarate-dependent taurine dioxygenase
MKISYAENDWTTIIDEDINTLSKDDLFEMTELLVNNTVVVFKKQKLTAEKELEICQVIGDCNKDAYDSADTLKNITVIPGIMRVTGAKNKEGHPGLFGHVHDLDWHANKPSAPNRKPLVWLYGVHGTLGSKTSWLNCIHAYNDLDEDFKEEIKDIKAYCGFKPGTYSDSPIMKPHINRDNPVNLVHTNVAGKTGLFFPFHQILEFAGDANDKFDDIMQRLKEHVLQEKYMYHHYWDDGDIVIAEQWLGIHKRWRFEGMESRLLHRITFDYSNVYKGD